jgi:uncharacterized protein Yka (UPF0111/DUF47 family)
MGNSVSDHISEDEELMRLLAIKLETDDFLLSELFEAEESEEEIDQLKQKRSRLIYERPDYTKSN